MGAKRFAAAAFALGLLVAAPMATATPNPSGGALHHSQFYSLGIAGRFGVPDDAKMVALHVGVARSAGPGHATVWPCAEDQPNTSVVNFGRAQLTQSLVLARLSDDGRVCVAAHDTTDFIIDIAGFVPAGSDLVALDDPTRIVNTRTSRQVRADETLVVDVAGRHGVSDDAQAAAFTVTAAQGRGSGHLSVVPCGASTDRSSTLNWPAGKAVPNFAFTRLGEGGAVCITPTTDVHLLVDLVAWVPAGATGYELLDSPRRVLDSRRGTGTPSRPFGAGESRPIRVDAPADAIAVIGNVTAARQPRAGFATVVGCGTTVGRASSLNWSGAPAVANMSIVPLGEGREPCVTAAFPTHLVYDVSGFITSADFFTPIPIERILDTRRGWEARCDFEPMASGALESVGLLMYAADGSWTNDRRFDLNVRGFAPLVIGPECDAVAYSADGLIHFVDARSGLVYDRTPDFGDGPMTATSDGQLLSVMFDPVRHIEGTDQHEHDVVVLDRTTGDSFRVDAAIPGDPGLNSLRGTIAEDGDLVGVVHRVDGRPWLTTVSLTFGVISTFELRRYERIDSVDVAPGLGHVVVAGRYPGFHTPDGRAVAPARVDVFTFEGERIDGFEGSRHLMAKFRGPGELLVCGQDDTGTHLDRYELFNPPQRIEFIQFSLTDDSVFLMNGCRRQFSNVFMTFLP